MSPDPSFPPVPGPFLRTLKGQRQDSPPVWFMRQAGRYLPEYRQTRSRSKDFLDFCYTPDLAVEATLQPIARYGLDAAIIFSDILVIPDALGQKVSFKPGHGPVLDPLKDDACIRNLSGRSVVESLKPVYEAIARTRAQLDPSVALIGFAGAPWTLAAYMIEGGGSKDFMMLKRWAFSGGSGFQDLIDILCDAVIEHLSAQIEAGCDAVQIFDSWAGVLDATHLPIWSVAPLARITRSLRRRHPEIPVILFPKGAGLSLEAYARTCSAQALSLDSSVPLPWIADTLQPHIIVQGNLDPAYLLAGGAAMRDAALRILFTLGSRPFIFNLGHGIVPATPPEHVGELVSLLRETRIPSQAPAQAPAQAPDDEASGRRNPAGA